MSKAPARIFITGSTDGLGRAAARALIDEGHQVVLHARSRERAAALDDLARRSAGLVVGDLGSAVETRSVAEQVNAIGGMDAVIHNAGAYAKMGGPGAPDDFEMGYLTQTWLATSDEPTATVSGRYWHHRRPHTPAGDVSDHRFQDQLSVTLAALTRVSLF